MSLLGATILTAIATAILAVGAIVTAILAYVAFRKQSQEVAILLEESQRQADERRRSQVRATATTPFSSCNALTDTVLTFRDAEGLLWIRMPDGTLTEQTRATPRHSILALTGASQPALPANAAESGEPEQPPYPSEVAKPSFPHR